MLGSLYMKAHDYQNRKSVIGRKYMSSQKFTLQKKKKTWGTKEMWMDEKWTLNALWIMFHDLMDFTLGSPQIGEPKVNVTWSPLNHGWSQK
jgi:hypothetical protein